jgi:hypothetical protein
MIETVRSSFVYSMVHMLIWRLRPSYFNFSCFSSTDGSCHQIKIKQLTVVISLSAHIRAISRLTWLAAWWISWTSVHVHTSRAYICRMKYSDAISLLFLACWFTAHPTAFWEELPTVHPPRVEHVSCVTPVCSPGLAILSVSCCLFFCFNSTDVTKVQEWNRMFSILPTKDTKHWKLLFASVAVFYYNFWMLRWTDQTAVQPLNCMWVHSNCVNPTKKTH